MTTFPGRFAGKAAVITGAAQGIGRAVALRLAREGGSVALIDRERRVPMPRAAQPFEAPSVSPLMNCFCSSRYTTSVGSAIIIDAAAIRL